jgi:Uma2 family endonuclease
MNAGVHPDSERLYTAQELEALGNRFRGELIEGRLVPMSPTKLRHGKVCSKLHIELGLWCRARAAPFQLLIGECGFVVARNPDVVLVPDVAVVASRRVQGLGDAFVEGAPEIAIEVLSESNTMAEMERKLRYYFAGGARSVWIIDPSSETAYVYRSLGERQIFGAGDVLADPLLAEFGVVLRELFE